MPQFFLMISVALPPWMRMTFYDKAYRRLAKIASLREYLGESKACLVRRKCRHWSKYAARFADTSNKRITLQCARELHARMQLGEACSVLEVGAGPGIGSQDILHRMSPKIGPKKGKKKLVATDLPPVMVSMARATLASAVDATGDTLELQLSEANGENLSNVATASVDRFVSNMCLQLTPDPDAMLREAKRVLTSDGLAGFTIWGKPEHSAKHALSTAVSRELGLEHGWDTRSFNLGRDLPALRSRLAAAGFSSIRIWPFWSGEDFASFYCLQSVVSDDEDLRAKAFSTATKLADQYLVKGFPIGLETYIVLAKQ